MILGQLRIGARQAKNAPLQLKCPDHKQEKISVNTDHFAMSFPVSCVTKCVWVNHQVSVIGGQIGRWWPGGGFEDTDITPITPLQHILYNMCNISIIHLLVVLKALVLHQFFPSEKCNIFCTICFTSVILNQYYWWFCRHQYYTNYPEHTCAPSHNHWTILIKYLSRHSHSLF